MNKNSYYSFKSQLTCAHCSREKKKKKKENTLFHISRSEIRELTETFEEGGTSSARHRETRDSVFSSCDYEGGKVPLQIRNGGKVFRNLSRGVIRGRGRKMGGGTESIQWI